MEWYINVEKRTVQHIDGWVFLFEQINEYVWEGRCIHHPRKLEVCDMMNASLLAREASELFQEALKNKEKTVKVFLIKANNMVKNNQKNRTEEQYQDTVFLGHSNKPSKEYPYFYHCPFEGMLFFKSKEERDEAAEEFLNESRYVSYYEAWPNEMTDLYKGEITNLCVEHDIHIPEEEKIIKNYSFINTNVKKESKISRGDKMMIVFNMSLLTIVFLYLLFKTIVGDYSLLHFTLGIVIVIIAPLYLSYLNVKSKNKVKWR